MKKSQEKLENKCKECENDTILKYADLQIDYDEAQKYIKLLEQCLDIKEQLNDHFRKENDDLKNELRVYKIEE